jgi:hypothetical protein
MKRGSVRITLDIPSPLYRKLEGEATARGTTVQELVLARVRTMMANCQRPQLKKLRLPLIRSKGPKVNLTNEMIYEDIDFP